MTASDSIIENSKRIAVLSHIRPDGDAVGSVLGLGLALKASGKDVQMVLTDGIPSMFVHLKGARQVVRQISRPVDLVVVLDISDLNRIGGTLPVPVPDLNIDHHITNLQFARINLVEPETVATSAILAQYMEDWGLTISQPVAEALLTGLVSDTLGFRTNNMNPQALRLAAELIDRGANLPDLYHRALVIKSFNSARYWGCGLARLKQDNGIVWTALTLEDRAASSYAGNDDADLVNMLATIQEAQIALIFVEQKGSRVKVSWRSQPGINVANLAIKFGGGGHPAASGAELSGSLEEIQSTVLIATHSLLEEQIGYNLTSPSKKLGKNDER